MAPRKTAVVTEPPSTRITALPGDDEFHRPTRNLSPRERYQRDLAQAEEAWKAANAAASKAYTAANHARNAKGAFQRENGKLLVRAADAVEAAKQTHRKRFELLVDAIAPQLAGPDGANTPLDALYPVWAASGPEQGGTFHDAVRAALKAGMPDNGLSALSPDEFAAGVATCDRVIADAEAKKAATAAEAHRAADARRAVEFGGVTNGGGQ